MKVLKGGQHSRVACFASFRRALLDWGFSIGHKAIHLSGFRVHDIISLACGSIAHSSLCSMAALFGFGVASHMVEGRAIYKGTVSTA
jgi:hypothetical protein